MLEMVLKRHLALVNPMSRYASNIAERWMNINPENVEKQSKEEIKEEYFIPPPTFNRSSTEYTQVAANYPLKISTSKLWFFNEMQQKNTYSQQIATLKTYSYNNFRKKLRSLQTQQKSRATNANKNFFDKLKKLYRETIKIKTKKTIMKKKPFSLISEDKEAIIEAYIKQKWDEANMPLNVDPVLSNHLLKQAEKNKSADLNISLSCSQYPYIPCPLQPSESFIFSNTSNYKHTSLAPLFTVDPIYTKKDNKLNASSIRCITVNFWNQFSNSSKENINMEENIINNAISTNMKQEDINIKSTPLPSTQSTELPKNTEEKPTITLKCQTEEVEKKPAAKVNIETIPLPEEITKLKTSIIELKSTSIHNKIRNVRETSVNLRSAKPEIIEKIKKETVFKKKLSTIEDSKRIKQFVNHLDLNFPSKMTCPNAIKPKINATQGTVINELKVMNKVNIPKYTNNKLLKQIKKFYEKSDALKNGKYECNQENNDCHSFNTIDNSQSRRNIFRGAKCQLPVTSPNTLKKK